MKMRYAAVALVLAVAGAASGEQAAEDLVKKVSAAYQHAGTYHATVTVEVVRAAVEGRPAVPPMTYRLDNAFDRAAKRLKADVSYQSGANTIRTVIIRDGATLRGRSDKVRAVAGADGQRRIEPMVRHIDAMPFAGEFTFELLQTMLPGVVGPGLCVDLEAALTGDARTAIGANPDAELTALPPDNGRPGVKFQGFGGGAEIAARFDPHTFLLSSLSLTAPDPAKLGGVASLTYAYDVLAVGQPLGEEVFALDTAGSEAAAAPIEVFGMATPRLMEGGPAPDFELKNLAGESVKLSEITDRVIVLDFWATWCPPCRKGLPALQGLRNWADAEGHSVGIYCVNVREGADKVEPFWAENKLTMNVLYDSDGAIGQNYGAAGIPTTVVISNGIVQLTQVGYTDGVEERIKAKIEELLAAGGTEQRPTRPHTRH